MHPCEEKKSAWLEGLFDLYTNFVQKTRSRRHRRDRIPVEVTSMLEVGSISIEVRFFSTYTFSRIYSKLFNAYSEVGTIILVEIHSKIANWIRFIANGNISQIWCVMGFQNGHNVSRNASDILLFTINLMRSHMFKKMLIPCEIIQQVNHRKLNLFLKDYGALFNRWPFILFTIWSLISLNRFLLIVPRIHFSSMCSQT